MVLRELDKSFLSSYYNVWLVMVDFGMQANLRTDITNLKTREIIDLNIIISIPCNLTETSRLWSSEHELCLFSSLSRRQSNDFNWSNSKPGRGFQWMNNETTGMCFDSSTSIKCFTREGFPALEESEAHLYLGLHLPTCFMGPRERRVECLSCGDVFNVVKWKWLFLNHERNVFEWQL